MIQQIKELIKELKAENYHYVIISDGSGTTVKSPCGFASVIFSAENNNIIKLSGALVNGTNNLAELMPFIYSFWYIENQFHPIDKDILCISDSELTVKQGNKSYTRNNLLWSCVDAFYIDNFIDWKWLPRNSNPILTYCDSESKLIRKRV